MRVNVTSWSDGCVITRKMGELQDALMKYQPYSLVDPDTGKFGVGAMGGDSNVIISAIYLRDLLSILIERSGNANKK